MRLRASPATLDLGVPLRAVTAATAFLTRVPMPASLAGPAEMVAGAPAFPLVGAALGALVGETAALLGRVEPAAVAAGIAVLLEVLLTGALHLDGLADSADGLGARGREHALAAMRDHALGAYGVCAIVLDLLLKTVALGALKPDPLAATIAALSVSRAAALPLAAALPYARPDSGTGQVLSERLRWPAALTAALLAGAIAVAALGAQAVGLLAAAALMALTVAIVSRRRLGGITGDTLGAATELTATACLLVAAGLAR
jgi:adenosylcobinamide-GDP ribazoletransferase